MGERFFLVPAWRDDPAPEGRLPAFQRATLPSGLKLVVAERHEVPVVRMNLLVDAGYASDQTAAPGTARAQGTVERFVLATGANFGGSDRPRLRYAVSDAERFTAVLTDLGGVDPANAIVLKEPKVRDLVQAIRADLQRHTAGERQHDDRRRHDDHVLHGVFAVRRPQAARRPHRCRTAAAGWGAEGWP